MASYIQRIVVVLMLVMMILGLVSPVAAVEYERNAEALVWLRQAQQPDGGFSSGFAEGSDFGTTVEVVLAAAAAGQDASTWVTAEGNSPLDYMASQVAAGQVTDVGNLSKALLVATATGQDLRSFGGVDLINKALATQDAEGGMFGDTLFKHAYAVLALHNAGVTVPETAITVMTSQFTEDDGWALFGGTTPGTADTNTTALVMQALVATGHADAAAGALAYLQRTQNEDGGFPYQKPSDWGTETDANSTAVVLQALYALDESLGAWAPNGTDPLGALLALWNEESGGYLWQASETSPNMLATAQAIQATEGMTLADVAVVGASNPPQLAAAGGPTPVEEATPAEDTEPLLPASGGFVGTVGLILVGTALLGAGLGLRRR